jgi:hypothetical protein
MSDDNYHNLLYFEASSMRRLYDAMEAWQNENHKRLLALCIQPDGSKFCCIALTNPTEVVIVGPDSNSLNLGYKIAEVTAQGRLKVISGGY